ncbi:MAG TPA: protein kinase [Baekduia sp.]|jgi:serine/threonine-protein kinase|nr:protein kinase [Baekduia sp.]
MAVASLILPPGTLLGGYRVEDVIGIGGMAVVYRAEQLNLGRAVALKVLSAELSRDPIFRERFRREGKHVAALEHPNIIPIYDADEEEGRLYLATRLIDGETLAQRMTSRGLSADETLALLAPIADALDAAHADGVIHRDVKPQNILLTARDHPFLADFGVAKSSNGHGLTASGSFLGSVSYASPEQIRGESLTSASDIYSLAAVLYQCLTGQVPYPRDTDASVMHAHLSEPPPVLPAAAGRLQDVVSRGMAKLPEHRYESAGALLRDAEAAVDLGELERRATPAFPFDAPARTTTQTSEPTAAPSEFTLAVDATAHDQRRPAPEAAAEPERRRRRGRLVLATAGLLVVTVVAALVVLLSRPGDPAAAPRTVAAGPLEVTYDQGWSATPASSAEVGALRLQDVVTVAGTGAPDVTVRIGRLRDEGVQAGALPAAAAKAFATPPKAAPARLGALAATQYDGRLRDGTTLRVAVAPSSMGEMVVACSVRSSPLTACADAVPSVRLTRGRGLQPGPDKALAAGLDAALAPVAARASSGSLRAAGLVTRAAAARRLSAADTTAAAAFAALKPRTWDAKAIAAVSAALKAEAHDLAVLASATSRRDRAVSLSAAAKVRADGRRLHGAVGDVRALGYTVRRPAPLAPAVVRKPRKRHHRAQRSTPVTAVQAPVAQSPVTQTPVTPAPTTQHYTPPAQAPVKKKKASAPSDYGPVVVAPAQ